MDPIIGTILGVHLWWYGLSYTLGFLNAHLFIRRKQSQLSLTIRSAYTLSLCWRAVYLLAAVSSR